jgi:hypothetical protein
MFHRNLLLQSSGCNEDKGKTLAPNTLQCHIPNDYDFSIQHTENKSVCVCVSMSCVNLGIIAYKDRKKH